MARRRISRILDVPSDKMISSLAVMAIAFGLGVLLGFALAASVSGGGGDSLRTSLRAIWRLRKGNDGIGIAPAAYLGDSEMAGAHHAFELHGDGRCGDPHRLRRSRLFAVLCGRVLCKSIRRGGRGPGLPRLRHDFAAGDSSAFRVGSAGISDLPRSCCACTGRRQRARSFRKRISDAVRHLRGSIYLGHYVGLLGGASAAGGRCRGNSGLKMGKKGYMWSF
ncbi:hypothetical protein SDC9_103569 [bioreactor metagenome]|uniref:Uncharacterized protein n=1 Tax=bioreactor metagenome TaxID=1076179 RepID=A0A645AU22_9ZZZZ